MHRMPLSIATFVTLSGLPIAAQADTKPFFEYLVAKSIGGEPIAWFLDVEDAGRMQMAVSCELNSRKDCEFTEAHEVDGREYWAHYMYTRPDGNRGRTYTYNRYLYSCPTSPTLYRIETD